MNALETKKAQIKEAFLAINSQCDGAHRQDGVGFNGFHAAQAKEDIYNIAAWSDSKCKYWSNALRIYSKQLAGLGIDYSNITWDSSFDNPAKQIKLEAGTIKISFNISNRAEFNTLKEAAKEIQGRRWNAISTSWDIFPTAQNKAQILAFAAKYDFPLSEEIEQLLQHDNDAASAASAAPTGNRITKLPNGNWEVCFTFDWVIVNAIKSLPSNVYRKWQPNLTNKPWHVAACPQLLALCEKFNFAGSAALAAELGGEKYAPAEENQPKANLQLELSTDQQARFEQIAEKLLPYQREAVKSLALALEHGGALDASDTGTGKTYMALAAAKVHNQPIFVVCPLAVKAAWRKVAAHFGLQIQVANYEILRRGKEQACQLLKKKVETRTGVKTVQEFTWTLSKDTIVIFDECHRLKDGATLQSQLGISALQQGYKVLGLSATAADNPLQMKFAGLLTGLFKNPKDFYGWAQAHGVSKSKWGYFQFNGSQQVLQAIHAEIFPQRGIRLGIKALGDAFPETQITADCYDLGENEAALNKVYLEMEAQLAELFERQKNDRLGCQGEHLVIRLRARQQAELLKVPALVEQAKDALESGLAVAIFVNFNETLQALAEKLGTDCTIQGGQADAVRQANIEKFQTDQEALILCNIRAGGVGVSLHGHSAAKTRLALICPTDSGQDLKQALGRVHRAQGAKSLQRIVFAANTIEAEVCQNVQAKIDRIDTLNDGDLALDSRIFEQ